MKDNGAQAYKQCIFLRKLEVRSSLIFRMIGILHIENHLAYIWAYTYACLATRWM